LSKADSQGIINKELLIERLEENNLSDANLIDKNAFQKKKARVNTKNQYSILFMVKTSSYEQQKYNLFREENEGYSKLIVEVLQNKHINEETIELVNHNIFSLIGNI
jgi:THO complex subunit 2